MCLCVCILGRSIKRIKTGNRRHCWFTAGEGITKLVRMGLGVDGIRISETIERIPQVVSQLTGETLVLLVRWK